MHGQGVGGVIGRLRSKDRGVGQGLAGEEGAAWHMGSGLTIGDMRGGTG